MGRQRPPHIGAWMSPLAEGAGQNIWPAIRSCLREHSTRHSDFGRFALGLCAAFAMLAGCGNGAQSQLAPPGPFQQSGAQARLGQLSDGLGHTNRRRETRVMVPHPNHGRSWMAPGAATKDLLYISNYYTDDVLVYSYPQDKLVGTLTGLEGPTAPAPTRKATSRIVNNNLSDSGEDAVEYKHGGTKPIATLKIGAGYAVTCSVDPTTGSLAVTVFDTYGSGLCSVATARCRRQS